MSDLTLLMGSMGQPMNQLWGATLQCIHEFMKDTKGFHVPAKPVHG